MANHPSLLDQLDNNGYCIVPDVLGTNDVARVRQRLLAAAQAFERTGASTFMPELDPNAHNIRVFNLIGLDATFRQLILHPTALEYVQWLLGEHFMISNFTANIAMPGSGSMPIHSDLGFVAPPPWLEPHSMNIIWCLDDVYESNGATRYIPGSHKFQNLDDLPDVPMQHTVPFEAAAGSFIVMDGRMWHTSGANITEDSERAMLFGYYSADFLRPQVNWNALLPVELQESLEPDLYCRLGLMAIGNTRQAAELLQQRLHERGIKTL
jgi:ectoine hydroxylase-related dioxygenase (phytanoyl-CoA dioxygenase family)